VRNAGAPSSSSSHVDRLGFSRRLVKDALRNTLLSVDFRLLAWPLPAPWPSGSPRPSSGGTSLSRRFLPWAAASSRCQCGTGMPGRPQVRLCSVPDNHVNQLLTSESGTRCG
jgi:hypothetical protein